jgi:hypothetical protein
MLLLKIYVHVYECDYFFILFSPSIPLHGVVAIPILFYF